MVDGVNQQPGLFQRIGNFFGAGDPGASQRIGTPFFPADPNAGNPTDPFANLSRAQRTMLGFAALRDAAGALEGRDTNFFAESLGGFEKARERERLRVQGAEANRNQQIENAIQAVALARATGDAGLMALADAQLQALGSAVTPMQEITLAAGGAMPSPSAMPATVAPATRPATGGGIMDATGAVVGDVGDEPLSPTAQTAMAPEPAPTPAPAVSPAIADLDRELADIDAQIQEIINNAPDRGQSASASFSGISLDDPQAEMNFNELRDQRTILRGQREALLAQEAAAAEEAAATQARLETRTPQVVNTLQTTQNLRQMIEENPGRTTGLVGSFLQNVPGSVANDARALALRIRANLGFDQLQAMREASPTGGALGQVAVQELDALQATIGNLDLTQTPGQILDQIADIENNYMRLIRRAYETSQDVEALDRALGGRPAFMVEGGAASAPRASGGDIPQITSDAEYDALPSGAQFMAPDGTIRRKP